MKTDYRVYRLSIKERVIYTAVYIAGAAAIGWLFFGRLYAGAVFLPALLFFLRAVRNHLCEKRRSLLVLEFREALNLFAVSLKAGYAVENAFLQASSELTSIYGRDAMIVREFRYISGQISFQVPAERLLRDFAARSGAEEIRNFAAVFETAKRNGGNLPKVIESTSDIISGRIEVEKEIDASLAAKRMEQRIMSFMPCGIILYMRLCSPGFLDVMYGTAAGLIVMSASLAVYALAVYWGMRIVQIDV